MVTHLLGVTIGNCIAVCQQGEKSLGWEWFSFSFVGRSCPAHSVIAFFFVIVFVDILCWSGHSIVSGLTIVNCIAVCQQGEKSLGSEWFSFLFEGRSCPPVLFKISLFGGYWNLTTQIVTHLSQVWRVAIASGEKSLGSEWFSFVGRSCLALLSVIVFVIVFVNVFCWSGHSFVSGLTIGKCVSSRERRAWDRNGSHL